jgi:hypothetical protein
LKVTDEKQQFRPQLAVWDGCTNVRLDGDISAGIFTPVMKKKNLTRKMCYNRTSQFCEGCNEWFKSLEEHCAGPKHRKFATTAANYAAVDATIADCGLDLKTFLAGVRNTEQVNDISTNVEVSNTSCITVPGLLSCLTLSKNSI